MQKTTLCYVERDGKYLMLHRNKKKKDVNEGKWIGVGGKFEPGESAEECLLREVYEETGLKLITYEKRGEIQFKADDWEEMMYLFIATEFEGELVKDCPEGELKWVPIEKILDLELWEGDRGFLLELMEGKKDIRWELYYSGDKLIKQIPKVSVDG